MATEHEDASVRDVDLRDVDLRKKDERDMRDPAVLGQIIIDNTRAERKKYAVPDTRPNAVAVTNRLDLTQVQNFPSHYSATDETIPAYRAKMQKQALEGNRYSLRTLLDKGWDVPEGIPAEMLEAAAKLSPADKEVIPDAPIRKEESKPERREKDSVSDIPKDRRIPCWEYEAKEPFFHGPHTYIGRHNNEYLCPGH